MTPDNAADWWTLLGPTLASWMLIAATVVLCLGIGLGLGLLLAWMARWSVFKMARPLGATRSQLLSRITAYAVYAGVGVLTLWAVGALTEIDFQWMFTAVAGAAGIIGIAAGFASQTSAANVISGLFLVGERPFEEGDIVDINGTVGVIITVDLLSVKLRTFENTYVRVPNETVMKATITNMSRFPIRRMELSVWVPPRTQLDAVRAVVEAVSASEPTVLAEPSWNVVFQEVGDRGVKLRIVAWTTRELFVDTRARWSLALLAALEDAGIDVLGRIRWEQEKKAAIGEER